MANYKIDIPSEHFPISEEEIEKARENNTLEEYNIVKVNRGIKFYDPVYNVHLGDLLYISSEEGNRFIPNIDADEELEFAEEKNKRKEERKNFTLQRKRMRAIIIAGFTSITTFAAGIGIGSMLTNYINNQPEPPKQPIVASADFATVTSNDEIAKAYIDYTMGFVSGIKANAEKSGYTWLAERAESAYRDYYAPACSAYYLYIDKDYFPVGDGEPTAHRNFRDSVLAFESFVTESFGESYAFVNSPFASAIEIDGKVYIAESLSNYNDGEAPEGSTIQHGILYVPYNDSVVVEYDKSIKSL